MADALREGFEPPEPRGSPVFKTGTINQTRTSQHVVGVARFELAASCSQSTRATICAIPRHDLPDNYLINLTYVCFLAFLEIYMKVPKPVISLLVYIIPYMFGKYYILYSLFFDNF